MVVRTYTYGTNDHALTVPVIRHLHDPSFLAGDWLVQAHIYYHYSFNRFYAFLLHWVSLEAAFFASYLLVLCLAMYALYLMAGAVAPAHRMPLFLFGVFTLVGWNYRGLSANLINENFEGNVPVLGLGLLSLYWYLRGGFPAAYLFAGLATVLHVQVGINLVLLYTVYALFHLREVGLSRLVWAGVAFALPASIELLPLVPVQLSGLGQERQFLEWIQTRSPHHFVLSSWNWWGTIDFFSVIAAGIAAAYLLRRVGNDGGVRRGVWFIVGLLGSTILTYVFTEVVPMVAVIKLMIYRMSVYAMVIAVLLVGRLAVEALAQRRDRLLSLVVTLGWIIPSLFLPLTGVLAVVRRNESRKTWRPLGYGLVAAAAGLLAASLVLLTRGRYLPVSNVSVKFVVVAVLSWLLVELWARDRRMVVLPLVMMALLTGAQATKLLTGRAQMSLGLARLTPWHEVTLWIRDNTPREARFISPPDLPGFQLYAERSTVVSFKAMVWLEKDQRIWMERLADLANVRELTCRGRTGCGRMLRAGYDSLSADDLRRLAAKYGASYLVARSGRSSVGPTIYRNTEFSVQRIEMGRVGS